LVSGGCPGENCGGDEAGTESWQSRLVIEKCPDENRGGDGNGTAVGSLDWSTENVPVRIAAAVKPGRCWQSRLVNGKCPGENRGGEGARRRLAV